MDIFGTLDDTDTGGGTTINDDVINTTTVWSGSKTTAAIAAAIAAYAPTISVPAMTSGTTAGYSYIATASSFLTTAPGYEAWKAFDGIAFNRWAGNAGVDYDGSGFANTNTNFKSLGHYGQWIKLQLPQPMRASAVKMTHDPLADTYYQLAISWIVLYSTDDITYNTAFSTTTNIFTAGIANATFTAPVVAKYFVVVVRRVSGASSNASITQLDFT